MIVLRLLVCATITITLTSPVMPWQAHASEYRAEDVEPPHARALISYNDGQYAATVEKLDALLAKYPKYRPALELKAISLRRLKKNKEAIVVYDQLIGLANSPSEKAPYHFEKGVIHYEAKKYKEAWPHLQYSARHGFNWGACNYFLGMISYEVGALEKAEFHFNAVLWSEAESLHGPASFYLGVIFSKMGNASGMLWAFDEAKRAMAPGLQSGDTTTKKAAEGIIKIADEAMSAMSKDRLYGNFLLQLQYDNNLPLLPDVIAVQQPTNKKSMKLVGTTGIGFITSPTRNWQINPVLRFYYNHNLNREAKGFSFFSNMPSFTFTLFPSRRFAPGLKLEGNLTFNDRLEGGKTVFRPFSLTGNLGPFVRAEFIPRLVTTFEFLVRPKHFYLDPTNEYLKRTGSGAIGKLSWRYNTLRWWLNPSGSISHEFDRTEGREFRARIWAGGIANRLGITSKDNLTFAGDFSRSRFSERNGAPRKDHFMSYRVLYSRTLNKYLTALADVAFTRNLSTVPDSYKYSRFLASLGLNAAF